MRHQLILASCLLVLAGCRTSPRAASSTTANSQEIPALAADLPPTSAYATSAYAPDPCCEPCDLGCWEPSDCRKTYLDATASFLPNLGIGIGIGRVLHRSEKEEWAVELAGTYQFIDDEEFANDGNPSAGDWKQVRAGVKTSSSPRARRHFTKRLGAVWLKAEGEPNLLQEPGNYWGVYASVGFETDVNSSVSIGPELAVLMVTPDDKFKMENPIPQLNWHFVWWPGGRKGGCAKRLPIGEFYAGAVATLAPGLGGGLEFGQVFTRSSLATWSFELMAGVQDASKDTLWFDQDGKWAHVRGGVKASFQPCKCGHWTARAGVTWMRSTATSSLLEGDGDYIGAYAGVGYEWDLGRHFTTGPELSVVAATEEKTWDPTVFPQFNWHFICKF